jgi:hypothetical protein
MFGNLLRTQLIFSCGPEKLPFRKAVGKISWSFGNLLRRQHIFSCPEKQTLRKADDKISWLFGNLLRRQLIYSCHEKLPLRKATVKISWLFLVTHWENNLFLVALKSYQSEKPLVKQAGYLIAC